MARTMIDGFIHSYDESNSTLIRSVKALVTWNFVVLALILTLAASYAITGASGQERAIISALVFAAVVACCQGLIYHGHRDMSVYIFAAAVAGILFLGRLAGVMALPETGFTTFLFYYFGFIAYIAVFGKGILVFLIAAYCLLSNYYFFLSARNSIDPDFTAVLQTGFLNSTTGLILASILAYFAIWISDRNTSEILSHNKKLGETSADLHDVLTRIQDVAGSLSDVSDRIAQTSTLVSKGATSTASSVDQTSSSMHEMLVSLTSIADNVDVLAKSARDSAASINEIVGNNDEIVTNVKDLASNMELNTSAIETMTMSIKEVAGSIEELSSAAEETSSSMNQMDMSINQVETNANETAKLSEEVSVDARIAAEALKKTIAGIDRIKDSSRTAADVIETLGQKIGMIGNILNVIDEVAEQTNLLALNAAIIAAQAGEHGKGFAVVADEIKDLAERTGSSTKEIADLIRAVQDESKNAITAMERGVLSVEDGVQLSFEADSALQKILDSAGRSTQMIKAIARATVEQARGSKQVTSSINRIAETVQQISRATSEQAKGSERIMQSSEKMKIITRQIEHSSQEQAQGSKLITDAIKNISDMVHQLNFAQREQTNGAEQIMQAVENIKSFSDTQSITLKDLEFTVVTLTEQSNILKSELDRFKTTDSFAIRENA